MLSLLSVHLLLFVDKTSLYRTPRHNRHQSQQLSLVYKHRNICHDDSPFLTRTTSAQYHEILSREGANSFLLTAVMSCKVIRSRDVLAPKAVINTRPREATRSRTHCVLPLKTATSVQTAWLRGSLYSSSSYWKGQTASVGRIL